MANSIKKAGQEAMRTLSSNLSNPAGKKLHDDLSRYIGDLRNRNSRLIREIESLRDDLGRAREMQRKATEEARDADSKLKRERIERRDERRKFEHQKAEVERSIKKMEDAHEIINRIDREELISIDKTLGPLIHALLKETVKAPPVVKRSSFKRRTGRTLQVVDRPFPDDEAYLIDTMYVAESYAELANIGRFIIIATQMFNDITIGSRNIHHFTFPNDRVRERFYQWLGCKVENRSTAQSLLRANRRSSIRVHSRPIELDETL